MSYSVILISLQSKYNFAQYAFSLFLLCYTCVDVRCYMNLWGVAVLELDCHPDHNKGLDYAPCACP